MGAVFILYRFSYIFYITYIIKVGSENFTLINITSYKLDIILLNFFNFKNKFFYNF